MSVEVYSQRDRRWSDVHLGRPEAARESTIGAYGCAITCIAQKLTLLGWPTTPPDVQQRLLEYGAFRKDASRNLVDWARVPRAYHALRYNGRGDYPTVAVPPSTMRMIGDRLAKGDPVIVYVDASRYERGLQQHFVLVSGQSETGELYVHNPWTGQVQDLRAYGLTDVAAICGVIFLDWSFDAGRAI